MLVRPQHTRGATEPRKHGPERDWHDPCGVKTSVVRDAANQPIAHPGGTGSDMGTAWAVVLRNETLTTTTESETHNGNEHRRSCEGSVDG